MHQYHDLVRDILDNGFSTVDRTGVGTLSVFGRQSRYDLTQGFPLLTTKKTHFKSIAHELLWFLKGDTNIKYLKDNGVSIWDEWADENGDLGNVYGKQWRYWESVYKPTLDDNNLNFKNSLTHSDSDSVVVDQIKTVVERIRTNPDCRRLIVSAWNPGELHSMALPPCHAFFQFKVYGDDLYCQLYQRSADVFLGVPFNIASYALLTHMIAQVTGLRAKEFVHTLGDAHLYRNHLEQAQELLSRDCDKYGLPKLELNSDIKDIDHFTYDDISLVGYESYPSIKAPVAV